MSSSTGFQVRPAGPDDAEIIAQFNCLLAEETEHTRLDPPTVLAGVKQLLADPSKGRYLVAEEDGKVIGQLAHTREWSDWRNGDLWWIQSVYVRQGHRGGGVFRALYEHLEAMARESGQVVGIRLYVEQHNEKAQSAYQRLGLAKTDYQVMQKVWLPLADS
ncbi:putative acetyltransferase [Caulifigura coniformis]|uniref:Putative acetyltransferase n=1 Tax=Caulifigura coniformis TaxID=2527983 RepID=A0A517SFB7_9PLAN|nr:GNAT family N-acetyltransferase [Caulifigura coniformis]QDT54835.1 putative acetyltransferase [Caulifigura coniformis]